MRSERIKEALRKSWLFPRYLGGLYVRRALTEAKPNVKGRVLDVGCGLRQYESLLADRVTSYIGMDWPAFPQRAKPDVIGDALQMPFDAGCIDTVLATELIEHVPHPDWFLGEARRVLRAGGTLIVSVPFVEGLHEEPRDYYRFTPYALRLLLEGCGFSVERIWTKGGWWSVVLGSVLSQSLYDCANPVDDTGKRRDGLRVMFVLPLCAAAQLVAYGLDRLFASRRYTLGYVVMARLADPP